MERPNREYEIRPMVCDWALDIPMGYTTFVLHFNSRNNAELVKAVLEWEDAHPNEAVPYQTTLTPPDGPLTPEQLREMNGQPVWVEEINHWALIDIETGGRWSGIPFVVGAENGANFCYNIKARNLQCYRCQPKKREEMQNETD